MRILKVPECYLPTHCAMEASTIINLINDSSSHFDSPSEKLRKISYSPSHPLAHGETNPGDFVECPPLVRLHSGL